MKTCHCFGEVYCHRGIPMLKTRIQLPVLRDGQPADWMLSLSQVTEQYAVQTLLPAIRDAYDSLASVAEKMHFEPYRYRHLWHTEPHPSSSGLLTVRIETELCREKSAEPLLRTEVVVYINEEDGRLVEVPRKRRAPPLRHNRAGHGAASGRGL